MINKRAFNLEKLDLSTPSDKLRFSQLSENKVEISDTIIQQLCELAKIENPSLQLSNQDQQEWAYDYIKGKEADTFGFWYYYPWRNKLVHVLPEKEFRKVRFNRNKLKITVDEQKKLLNTTIGVVGLSVGNAVALTLAMEGVGGTLKLADFDTLDLSNLNRLRSGVCDLGLSKCIIAARQIAEINPYLKVELFEEGLTSKNMEEFLNSSKMDVLIEVCDSLKLKYDVRKSARELKIPVVMDTNDRGLVDIERFDLEPDRPIFHGLVDEGRFADIDTLSLAEKVPLVQALVGGDAISQRLKLSMIAIGKQVISWPQLASGVMLGGAVTTDVARRIILNQLNISGRFYIDFDELIRNTK